MYVSMTHYVWSGGCCQTAGSLFSPESGRKEKGEMICAGKRLAKTPWRRAFSAQSVQSAPRNPYSIRNLRGTPLAATTLYALTVRPSIPVRNTAWLCSTYACAVCCISHEKEIHRVYTLLGFPEFWFHASQTRSFATSLFSCLDPRRGTSRTSLNQRH